MSGALALSPPAIAQEGTIPHGNSGAEQYVEPVPDAGGERPAGPGADGRGGNSRLPDRARRSLPGGREGEVLRRLATDPGSGAPARDGAERRTRTGSPDEDEAGPLSAAAGAVFDSDGGGVGLLLLAGLGLTAAVAAAAIRRASRRSPG